MISEVTGAGRVSYTPPNKSPISYSNYYKFKGCFEVKYIIKSYPWIGLPVWLNTCYGDSVWDDIKNSDIFFLNDNNYCPKCLNKKCEEQNQGDKEVEVGLTFIESPDYCIKVGDKLYYDMLI